VAPLRFSLGLQTLVVKNTCSISGVLLRLHFAYIDVQIGGQQQRASGGKLVTRKFTLRQNHSAPCSAADSRQLLCQGRSYEADSTREIGRRRGDVQRSHSATLGSSTTKTSSGVVAGAIPAWPSTATVSGRSVSALAQSMTVQRVQLRHRTPQSSTALHHSPTTFPSPEPASAGNQ